MDAHHDLEIRIDEMEEFAGMLKNKRAVWAKDLAKDKKNERNIERVWVADEVLLQVGARIKHLKQCMKTRRLPKI